MSPGSLERAQSVCGLRPRKHRLPVSALAAVAGKGQRSGSLSPSFMQHGRFTILVYLLFVLLLSAVGHTLSRQLCSKASKYKPTGYTLLEYHAARLHFSQKYHSTPPASTVRLCGVSLNWHQICSTTSSSAVGQQASHVSGSAGPSQSMITTEELPKSMRSFALRHGELLSMACMPALLWLSAWVTFCGFNAAETQRQGLENHSAATRSLLAPLLNGASSMDCLVLLWGGLVGARLRKLLLDEKSQEERRANPQLLASAASRGSGTLQGQDFREIVWLGVLLLGMTLLQAAVQSVTADTHAPSDDLQAAVADAGALHPVQCSLDHAPDMVSALVGGKRAFRKQCNPIGLRCLLVAAVVVATCAAAGLSTSWLPRIDPLPSHTPWVLSGTLAFAALVALLVAGPRAPKLLDRTVDMNLGQLSQQYFAFWTLDVWVHGVLFTTGLVSGLLNAWVTLEVALSSARSVIGAVSLLCAACALACFPHGPTSLLLHAKFGLPYQTSMTTFRVLLGCAAAQSSVLVMHCVKVLANARPGLTLCAGLVLPGDVLTISAMPWALMMQVSYAACPAWLPRAPFSLLVLSSTVAHSTLASALAGCIQDATGLRHKQPETLAARQIGDWHSDNSGGSGMVSHFVGGSDSSPSTSSDESEDETSSRTDHRRRRLSTGAQRSTSPITQHLGALMQLADEDGVWAQSDEDAQAWIAQQVERLLPGDGHGV